MNTFSISIYDIFEMVSRGHHSLMLRITAKSGFLKIARPNILDAQFNISFVINGHNLY